MPWSKPHTGTETARAGNTDVQGRFYFSDASATPPNELRVAVTLVSDLPTGGTKTEVIDVALTDISTMTTTERNQLKARLAQVRDFALAQAGFAFS